MIVQTAAVQMRSGVDPEANARDLEELVRQAAGLGAVFVQTPEMTGIVQRKRHELEKVVVSPRDDVVVSMAAKLAGELGIHLHIGSTAIRNESGGISNRAFLFAPDGSLRATYDKIHMFDVDLENGESWRESAIYSPGSRCVVAQLPFAVIGLAICYDLRFPHLFRDQALAGAQLLTVPSAFTRQTGKQHWHVLVRARAIENGAWVIAAAQGGLHEDGRETFGHSLIVNPAGEIVAEADHDEPAVIVAEIDPTHTDAARGKIPNLNNGRDYCVEFSEIPGAKERRAS